MPRDRQWQSPHEILPKCGRANNRCVHGQMKLAAPFSGVGVNFEAFTLRGCRGRFFAGKMRRDHVPGKNVSPRLVSGYEWHDLDSLCDRSTGSLSIPLANRAGCQIAEVEWTVQSGC